MNGLFPIIELHKDAKSEVVIDAAVNITELDSKAYRVMTIQPFVQNQMPEKLSISAVLLQVGKSYKVVVFYPLGDTGWWSRFYFAEAPAPASSPTTTRGAQ